MDQLPTTPPLAATNTSPAPPSSPPPADAPAADKPHRPWWRNLWLPAVIILVLAGLGGAYLYVSNQFKQNINPDHAEHQQLSPSVHDIVHVRQKLVVGTDETFEPMEFIRDGQRVGFDIDLGREIAKELNVSVEFVTVDFDSIFAEQNLGGNNVLTNGTVDILLDSVTITAQRQQYYLFSDPYINVGQVALTLTSNQTINDIESLRGRRITVAPSTTNESLALTLTTSDRVVRHEDPADQARAVLNGDADAMLVDLTNAKRLVDNHPGLKIATDPLTDENYGAVIAKGKEDLLEEINRILTTLRQRGVLEGLKQKWLE